MELQGFQTQLRLEGCGGDAHVLQDVLQFVGASIAVVKLRFRWLSCTPYLFANACHAPIAAGILQEHDRLGAQALHRVTVDLVSRYRVDLEAVAKGAAPTAALLAEVEVFRQCPLSEASIEGYHAEAAKVCLKSPAGKEPFVFSQLRLRSNMERLREWYAKPAGASIIQFGWTRHKALLRLGSSAHRSRGLKVTYTKFRSLFYRLRADTFDGDVLESRDLATKIKR